MKVGMVIRELIASLFFPMGIVGSWRLCVAFSSHAAVVGVYRLQQSLIVRVPGRNRRFVSTHWFSEDLCSLLALQALCFTSLAGVSPSRTHAGRCNPSAREEFTADRSDLLATTPFRPEHTCDKCVENQQSSRTFHWVPYSNFQYVYLAGKR